MSAGGILWICQDFQPQRCSVQLHRIVESVRSGVLWVTEQKPLPWLLNSAVSACDSAFYFMRRALYDIWKFVAVPWTDPPIYISLQQGAYYSRALLGKAHHACTQITCIAGGRYMHPAYPKRTRGKFRWCCSCTSRNYTCRSDIYPKGNACT